MKLRREARTLKGKALSSLRRGLASFNGFEEDGRVTTVLLHLQHCCEMLVKAGLVQKGVSVFDKSTKQAEGFSRSLNLACAHCGISTGEAGMMRTIDSLRDAEQHWLLVVPEDLLFLHVRGLVTVVDDILKRLFDGALVDHLPNRVLPVSTLPMTDIDLLVDREYTQIGELLKPGRRARDEARGRIRSLLAMESHVVDEVAVSERDIDRIERAVRAKEPMAVVFPRLQTLSTSVMGQGYEIKVHFTKKQGAPVRFVAGDDPTQAAAVRELDLRKKYHMQATALAEKVGLTPPKAKAVRDFLGVDDDPQCTHVFEFMSQKIPCYSDNAVTQMKKVLTDVPIEEIWAGRKAKEAKAASAGR